MVWIVLFISSWEHAYFIHKSCGSFSNQALFTLALSVLSLSQLHLPSLGSRTETIEVIHKQKRSKKCLLNFSTLGCEH